MRRTAPWAPASSSRWGSRTDECPPHSGVRDLSAEPFVEDRVRPEVEEPVDSAVGNGQDEDVMRVPAHVDVQAVTAARHWSRSFAPRGLRRFHADVGAAFGDETGGAGPEVGKLASRRVERNTRSGSHACTGSRASVRLVLPETQ